VWDKRTSFVFLAATALFAVYFPLAILIQRLDPVAPNITGEKILMRGAFPQKREWGSLGYAYSITMLGKLDRNWDSMEDGSRSPLLIYENDRPIGPAHSNHVDIQNIGRGRYSHWENRGVVFSTSDNTNPNTNGRAYWIVDPSSTGAK
jgi:hypothetical protein